MMDHTTSVLGEVSAERRRQDAKWGVQRHPDGKWFQILMEEVGEASKASLENDRAGMREELVQVAAVAVAIVEAMDASPLRSTLDAALTN